MLKTGDLSLALADFILQCRDGDFAFIFNILQSALLRFSDGLDRDDFFFVQSLAFVIELVDAILFLCAASVLFKSHLVFIFNRLAESLFRRLATRIFFLASAPLFRVDAFMICSIW